MIFLLSILCFFILSCNSSGDGMADNNPSIDECGDSICAASETIDSCPEDCETTIACSDGREGFCENPQFVGNQGQDSCYPCNFVYSTSTQLGYYVFKEVKINNQYINPNDWVGAFNGDVCVGAREWGACNGDLSCDVPVLGDDGSNYSNGYMLPGDIPSFKIYDVSEATYFDAISSGAIQDGPNGQIMNDLSWSSNISLIIDLLSASSSPFTLEIDQTGTSTLFIFLDSITGLEIGDEIALFDDAGIIDDSGSIGQIMVGVGVWTGEQLEITAIGSSDLSSFEGPILPGYVSSNTMILKVWDKSEQVECDATYTTSFGSGLFNGLFSNIDSITLGDCN